MDMDKKIFMLYGIVDFIVLDRIGSDKGNVEQG